MKFKRGDVVRYITAAGLCPDFKDKWGVGPFIVRSIRSADTLTLTTLGGVTLTGAPVGDKVWTNSPSLLIKDVFLSSAYHATKENHAKSKTRAKQKSKPAARRSRAA